MKRCVSVSNIKLNELHSLSFMQDKFVLSELRLKRFGTALFCVTMLHVVFLTKVSEQPINPILTFGFLTPKDGTDRLS
jgi:hypothetical protein